MEETTRILPVGLCISRASMDARWKARQLGQEQPPLEMEVTWGSVGETGQKEYLKCMQRIRQRSKKEESPCLDGSGKSSDGSGSC